VSFQKELWHHTTLDVGYVGNYGYDLLRATNPQLVASGDKNGNGTDDRVECANSGGGASCANLMPFPALGDKNMVFWEHGGESQYHSLQTQFISRFGRGSQVQASYTLARTRANINLSNSGSIGEDSPIDLSRQDLEWGRPDVGRTHIFNASLVWLLPSLEDKGGMQRALFGDWEIASIVGAASGQPFTALANDVPGLNGGPTGTGYTDNQRPNRTGASCRPDGGLPEQIINPDAYTLDGFKIGSVGTAKRGDCTGPNAFQADLALYKNFRITDRVRMQFRWDIFNLFNNTNFVYGSINRGLASRSATISADGRTIVDATSAGNFGQATRTRDPRQMQFGFKFLW